MIGQLLRHAANQFVPEGSISFLQRRRERSTREVEDHETGALLGRVTLRVGDVAAMPADIRHHGFSPKRSMRLVWESGSPKLPAPYASGKMPPTPVQF
jgi:hypothetical protein